jgi:hypothetical protein
METMPIPQQTMLTLSLQVSLVWGVGLKQVLQQQVFSILTQLIPTMLVF